MKTIAIILSIGLFRTATLPTTAAEPGDTNLVKRVQQLAAFILEKKREQKNEVYAAEVDTTRLAKWVAQTKSKRLNVATINALLKYDPNTIEEKDVQNLQDSLDALPATANAIVNFQAATNHLWRKVHKTGMPPKLIRPPAPRQKSGSLKRQTMLFGPAPANRPVLSALAWKCGERRFAATWQYCRRQRRGLPGISFAQPRGRS
jgi:hypothetical protein